MALLIFFTKELYYQVERNLGKFSSFLEAGLRTALAELYYSIGQT